MKQNLIFFLILTFVINIHAKDKHDQINVFFNKKNVTILITDSGLGGLSVVADLSKKLPHSGIFNKASIIFFNSQFHEDSGYNSIDSENEKVRIFNIALNAMVEKYQPDLILIACNTLSVIYDQTPFSKEENVPVIGIVEAGVDLIAEQFNKTPRAYVIIFATETTINSNSHKNRLINRGYHANQIIGQACPLLSESIEQGYNSELTWAIIEEYKSVALGTIPESNPGVFVSLNCSHYGYSIELFQQVFADAGYPDIEILDPNSKMTEFMFESKYMNRFKETLVTIQIVSKTNISDIKIQSLSTMLDMTCHKTSAALREYTHNPNLFDPKIEITH